MLPVNIEIFLGITMTYKRIENGRYLCNESEVEFMSTWKFERTFHKKLDDVLTAQLAKQNSIPHEKKCAIEFEKARKIYGDYVYMYPVNWLKTL
ncbi:hypothetical protein [Shewanella putrefaciens]|uniref:hypothetical protein n=1 Tax=Shewanella putrefaciens TaxID=24 RepID=UPI0035623AE2